MTFVDDLKNCSLKAAKMLRKGVTISEESREYWGMRQEPQMVAETYYLLRNDGYEADDLYLEYYYKKKVNGHSKRLEADLIYGDDVSAQVVEFKVFWDGDLKKDGGLSASAQRRIKSDYDKLREYSSFSEVGELALVAAFIGPEELYKSKQYSDSVMDSFHGNSSFSGVRGRKITIVPC